MNQHGAAGGPLLLLVVLVAIILLGVNVVESLGWIIINSLVGLVLLVIVNFFPFINISINIWTILIVALGGIPGLLLLVLLELAGIDV